MDADLEIKKTQNRSVAHEVTWGLFTSEEEDPNTSKIL